MEKYTDTVGTKLNLLLEKNYDAEKGYKNASENTENLELKKFFTQRAAERKIFAKELKLEIIAINQEYDRNGSLLGDIHRTWMDLKTVLFSNDDEAILEEAVRGEKASIEEYNSVLSEIALPQSTKAILETQKTKLELSLASVKVLEFLH